MTNMTRRVALACAAAYAALAGPCIAQSAYPNKPIAVQVGLQAGTGSDVAVRTMLDRVGTALGQPFVIENSPGASGFVAAQKALRAPADGYQLVALNSGTVAVLPHLDPSLKFNPQKDLVPIAVIASIPSVLFVHPSVPVRSATEFVDYARKNPGKLTYASGGVGSVQHLAMESFKATTRTAIVHIPYKGSGQATIDIVGGRVDAAFQGVVQVVQHAKQNQVRLLAWGGTQRYPLFPDLPTLQEAGVKDFFYEPWTALFGPADLPDDVAEKLNAEIAKVAAQPDLRERWAAQGLEPKVLSVAQTRQLVKAEFESQGRLIRDLGITNK